MHHPLIAIGYKLTNNNSTWGSRYQDSPNFGTVLFDKNDVIKECWSNDELTLLNSRVIFNDIMPQVDMIDNSDDKYIDMLMDYVDICMEMVEKLTSGKTKLLVMKALADTIGGYLQVYIIPLTKDSYYTGKINYQKAKRIFDLYDDVKYFLRTNGVGWLKPIILTYHLNATSIFIPRFKRSRNAQTSCSNLILYSDNDGREESVPIPYLDDNKTPSSIALPYENESLCSLYTEKSAFILVKYYIDGINCMTSLSEDKNQLNKFKRHLNDWLHNAVKPLLNDDEVWYPAFGGVLRVIKSLETDNMNIESDLQQYAEGYDAAEDENYVDSISTESSLSVPPIIPPIIKKQQDTKLKFNFMEITIITVAFLLLIYLLIGICINWYLIRSKERSRIEAYKKTPIHEFYEKPRKFKYSRSKRSSRHLKLLNQCSCSDEEDDEEKYLNEFTYSSSCTSVPVRKKQSKSFSAPAIIQRNSSTGLWYTSDETSAFSPRVKETSS
ncbi:hypothetical protein PV327_001256 [Microctonus hyperodae]|uniref:Uncharacterized protein n=1 Tax=Microctonus hyperodae TaxID=165561 RepID=A0AA39L309_MICHY|nr:hypothetical protein PV327_001256 [Microctonus hyperodae]